MDGDTLELDILAWPVLLICYYPLNSLKHIQSMDDTPKDCVATIQLRVCSIRDEELAACNDDTFIFQGFLKSCCL